jgi:hypothetical protein
MQNANTITPHGVGPEAMGKTEHAVATGFCAAVALAAYGSEQPGNHLLEMRFCCHWLSVTNCSR